MQLITEKISVPKESPRLSRPRLLTLLQRLLDGHSATVICGRAGTGKTLLAADFARQCGRRVAWFRVDAADNDPHIFFHYLLESVRRQRPNFHRRPEEQLREPLAEADLHRLAESVVYGLQESSAVPLLIVIEDLHLVYDEEWVAPFFSRFVPLLTADVHLLVVTRSVPPVPLWRMRSKQTLAIVDEQCLAFSMEEACKLFVSYGLDEGAALRPMVVSHVRAAVLDNLARRLCDGGSAEAELCATYQMIYLPVIGRAGRVRPAPGLPGDARGRLLPEKENV